MNLFKFLSANEDQAAIEAALEERQHERMRARQEFILMYGRAAQDARNRALKMKIDHDAFENREWDAVNSFIQLQRERHFEIER